MTKLYLNDPAITKDIEEVAGTNIPKFRLVCVIVLSSSRQIRSGSWIALFTYPLGELGFSRPPG